MKPTRVTDGDYTLECRGGAIHAEPVKQGMGKPPKVKVKSAKPSQKMLRALHVLLNHKARS